MFDRYTESARRALFFSRYEASVLGRRSIETEHVLLGLLRAGKGLTDKLFALAQVSCEPVLAKLPTGTGEKVPTSVEIPFSVETKRVLSDAVEESDQLGHGYIGTEHLLLGLLREEASVAGAILSSFGMQLESARTQLRTLLDASAVPSEPPSDAGERAERIEQIRHLVNRLEHAAPRSAEAQTLIDRIRHTLESLS